MYNQFSLQLPKGENSSCLQSTVASLLSQESSHIVPQVLLKQTSTRPKSVYLLSPFKRTSLFEQGAITKHRLVSD